MDVDAAVRTAAACVDGIVSVYLFGSFAAGRDHRESDVDLGVLLDRRVYPGARERFEVRLLLGTSFSDAFGRRADVVILNDAPPQFARAIVTGGRRLLVTDEDRDRDFVRDAQLLAADIEPFLRRMRALKLESGVRQ